MIHLSSDPNIVSENFFFYILSRLVCKSFPWPLDKPFLLSSFYSYTPTTRLPETGLAFSRLHPDIIS